MYTRTLAALAALALTAGTLALSTPLHAAPADEQVRVRTGDLDLSDSGDAARLERRLRAAARQICGWVPVADLNMQKQVAGCQDEAIANARDEAALAMAARRTPFRLALRTR
jgi:UrcA family protein